MGRGAILACKSFRTRGNSSKQLYSHNLLALTELYEKEKVLGVMLVSVERRELVVLGVKSSEEPVVISYANMYHLRRFPPLLFCRRAAPNQQLIERSWRRCRADQCFRCPYLGLDVCIP